MLLERVARLRAALQLKLLGLLSCRSERGLKVERRRPAVPVVARGRLEVVSARLRGSVDFTIFQTRTLHTSLINSQKVWILALSRVLTAAESYGTHQWYHGDDSWTKTRLQSPHDGLRGCKIA